jgi:hypothetical protein
MSNPSTIRLKRKATDAPPDTLVVKRAISNQLADDIRYQRRKTEDVQYDAPPQPPPALFQDLKEEGTPDKQSPGSSRRSSTEARRTFHLSRGAFVPAGVKKRKRDVPTIEEQRRVSGAHRLAQGKVGGDETHVEHDGGARPQKRPGKGAAVRSTNTAAQTPVPAPASPEKRRLGGLADELHQFALDELARTPKPKLTAAPRLSATRSRDLHRRRTAAAAPSVDPGASERDMADADADNDAGYVYDTYILAADPAGSSLAAPDDIGYLIIDEEDQSLWETFGDDDQSDKGWDTDEEDENAEDYYGADYPEDELASDDEFDRNAYGYRRHGDSDNEEWDEDTGTYSDDEYERMMNPFKAL